MKRHFALAVKLAVPLVFAIPAALIGGSTPSNIALGSSPNPSVYGRPVTLTAAVAPPTATGSVTFYDNTTVLGTAVATAGQATLNTILLPSGARSLKAYYSGDTNYAPSTSSMLAQSVNAVPGGGFPTAVRYATGIRPTSVAVGDFNGDGNADLVTANQDDRDVSVLLGNGDGTFQAATNSSVCCVPSFIAVGDFNGDGKADLAIANYSIFVLLGNGDGTFQQAVAYGPVSGSFNVAVGDFNGDGRADLVATGGGNNVSVLLGNGDGTFQGAGNYIVGADPASVAVGDFNGDGRADLVVVNSSDVSVLLGNGDGSFQAAVNYGAGNGPTFAAVGDFNGDGRADLAVSTYNGNNVSVLLGNGDGTFQSAQNYGAGDASLSVAVGDFNGDGRADLVAGNGDGSVSVLLGNGDGTFRAPVNYRSGANYGIGGNPLFSMVVGNFNADGRTDVATANSVSNDVGVLLGLAQAPLSVTVTHAGNFAQGQSGGTYAITVSNDGFAATSGTVTATDSLPAGLVATNISGTGWTCALTTLSCTRADPLAAFASYPVITVTVSVAANAPGGVTNTVSVFAGGQTNTANATVGDFTTTFTPSQVAQAWSSLKPPASLTDAGAALLLTDGTIMVQQDCSSNWYRLAPDSFGNYANGTWSQAASMPPGYGPHAFSSAVLADGRLVVIGGEYNVSGANGCTDVETNLGAIFDPVADVWAP